MAFVQSSQLTPRSVEWLWPGRLPAVGPSRAGRWRSGGGQVAGHARSGVRIDDGGAVPGRLAGRHGGVGDDRNAEDRARDTIYSRLDTAGVDRNRIIVWKATPNEPWLRLPSQLRRLDDVAAHSRSPVHHRPA